jgi:VanZ family protein
LKRLTVVFILFILLIILIADLGLGPELFFFLPYIPGGDTTGHFVLIGLLAFLVNMTLRAAHVTVAGASLLKGSVIITIIVTLEEFSQLFLDNRGFSLVDLAADYAGILLFGWLAIQLTKRREKSEISPGGA